tara:strand:- start:781 stop:960 length:180 start_codon:yes stop_codon:yes gene_type:complete
MPKTYKYVDNVVASKQLHKNRKELKEKLNDILDQLQGDTQNQLVNVVNKLSNIQTTLNN